MTRQEKENRGHSQSKNTFIYITWITSANKNLLYRATVLIRLVLTSEATSRVSRGFFFFFSALSSQTISSLKFQNVRSQRRHKSADIGGAWISSVTPATTVGSKMLVVFFRSSRLHFLLPLGGHSSSMFPLEVSGLKKLMKKCLTVPTAEERVAALRELRGFFKTSATPLSAFL